MFSAQKIAHTTVIRIFYILLSVGLNSKLVDGPTQLFNLTLNVSHIEDHQM